MYGIKTIVFSNDCKFDCGIQVYGSRICYSILKVVAKLVLGVWVWH